jgi:hypothetical protein
MKLRLVATALAANFMAVTAAIALDAKLPACHAVRGISGQLKSRPLPGGGRCARHLLIST